MCAGMEDIELLLVLTGQVCTTSLHLCSCLDEMDVCLHVEMMLFPRPARRNRTCVPCSSGIVWCQLTPEFKIFNITFTPQKWGHGCREKEVIEVGPAYKAKGKFLSLRCQQ